MPSDKDKQQKKRKIIRRTIIAAVIAVLLIYNYWYATRINYYFRYYGFAYRIYSATQYAGQKNLYPESDYNTYRSNIHPGKKSELCTCENGVISIPVNEKGTPTCFVIRRIYYQNRELRWLHNPVLKIPGFIGFFYTMWFDRGSPFFEISSDLLHDKKALAFIEKVFADPCSFIPKQRGKYTFCGGKNRFSGTYEVRFVDKNKSIVHTKYYIITNRKE